MTRRRRVLTIMKKDLLEVARNKQAVAPLVAVPLIFVVLIPAAIILLGGNPAVTASINGLQSFLDNLPTGILPAELDNEQAVIYAVIVYFMAPLFLIIPVMIATITASSSFVGEKERRTIEGLLYTPVTDRELVLGKILASVLPSIAITWGAFLIYTLVVNVLGGPILGGVFFPTPTWIVIVVALAPLVAFLATSLIVAVSGRSTTVQGAQGATVLVILPVVALVVGQASGLLLFDMSVALIFAAVLAVIDVVVFLVVARLFQRERIVTRLS